MKENMEIRNVVSLFDGMSCTYMALLKAGIKFDKYYSSELDKHAIKQSSDWFPDIIRLGDVTKWKEWDIDWSKVDLLVGGFPCQGFSFAGKQLAFNDDRSKLFFILEDILKHILSVNPNAKFLLENVFMKKEHEQVINNRLNITEPLKINSALLSAQNRKRNYWTNIYSAPDGLWGGFKSMIPQPQDKGILLKDILEPDDEVDEKYYLSDKMIQGFINANEKHKEKGNGFYFSPKEEEGKSNTVNTRCYKMGVDDNYVCVAMRGRNPDNPSDRKAGSPTKQRLEPQKDGKTNCITSVGKDNLVLQLNQSKESGGKQPYQQNRIYSTDGIIPALNAQLGGRNNVMIEKYKIRRLTPRECARLQTVPDRYKWTVSDTQAYKMCGNGFTVDVIAYILSFVGR